MSARLFEGMLTVTFAGWDAARAGEASGIKTSANPRTAGSAAFVAASEAEGREEEGRGRPIRKVRLMTLFYRPRPKLAPEASLQLPARLPSGALAPRCLAKKSAIRGLD